MFAYLTCRASDLLRLAAAGALAPRLLGLAFNVRIQWICVVFALLCFHYAAPGKCGSILLVCDLILNLMPAVFALRNVERLHHWTIAAESND